MDQFNHTKPHYAGVGNDPAKQQAFDSMFSYFTIPVPKPDQSQKTGRTQQYQIREGEKYFLLTPELLKLKQSDAAAKLDIHPSTFSKKWRQSLPDRKWPYRKHCKIERQISKLKEQGQQGDNNNDHIQELISLRDKNLEPAVIVVSDDMPANKDAVPSNSANATTAAVTDGTTTTTTADDNSTTAAMDTTAALSDQNPPLPDNNTDSPPTNNITTTSSTAQPLFDNTTTTMPLDQHHTQPPLIDATLIPTPITTATTTPITSAPTTVADPLPSNGPQVTEPAHATTSNSQEPQDHTRNAPL